MEGMKYGVAFANIGAFTDPVEAIRLAVAAEAAGFDRSGRWTTWLSRAVTNRPIPTTPRDGFPPAKVQFSQIHSSGWPTSLLGPRPCGSERAS